MSPQMCEEPNHQALNYDRFSNCGNDCDAAPTASQHRRIVNRVHFAPSVHVQPIANRDDFSPEEVYACFYSSEDKDIMYGSFEKTVSRIEAGKRPKKNTSYRGLEHFVESNSSQLDNIVHACVDAVMDEQDRQWAEGCFDWGLFRESSLKVSPHSASLAYKMAAYDENEARKAYISMAKERRQPQDDASVSTETTEISKSTMAHDIKIKHNKTKPTDQSVSSSSKKSKTKKKQSTGRPPKAPSSGSRKMMGGGLESLKNKLYTTKMIQRVT